MQPDTANPPGVYLDHAATTPLDPGVAEAFSRALRLPRANPSSRHAPGAAARRLVEEAREEAALLIGASPEEVYFTSGGTESDALGVIGLARAAARERGARHVVLSAVEHSAVREAAAALDAEGFEITRLGVDRHGLVDPDELAAALRQDTALAAVMWANNEVGTVQPVGGLAGVCRERGVPLHCDAVQAVGHLPVDVSGTPVSTLAFTGHKLYGPSGVGALYVRGGSEVTYIEPLLRGGGQERGLRGGTENVAGIAAFGEACRLARAELEERARRERVLRGRLVEGVTAIPGVRLNGHPERRLPGNAHLSVEGADAESVVMICDALGYAIGNGAACSSADQKASTVLLAMGLSEAEAFSSVRVSVGKDNTPEEIDGFLEAFSGAVARLREMSPLYAG
ncbi:cysteine desulfurase family protein [Rubrobacter aplysinae]|uniref:cysteine desulfurase family protein n=1 Tax=Rubrobacter aplysinae TaxID=909625 RepID=UPI00064BF189|nr:cysteine desulfurase family protein [Rubrobacter aplysinae]